MSSFWWNIYDNPNDEPIEIVFSLCRNGRWMEDNGNRIGIWFDYLEYNRDELGSIAIGLSELEDLGEDVTNMLLQVLNLDGS